MIFKVGDKIFDDKNIPMMIVMTKRDKGNIQNMLSECTKYAVFPDDSMSKDEMHMWMNMEH